MTAIPLSKSDAGSGLQPIDVSRHLAGLADLIEVCFSADMDAGGRSVIREMRLMSHFGFALPFLNFTGLLSYPWLLGYVWMEDGKVVGAVNTQRAEGETNTWLIANVAVLPGYRRRGLALALMKAALDLIRSHGAVAALLQVDDDNLGAIELYRRLGFVRITTQTAWSRPALTPPPARPPTAFILRPRRTGEWAEQFALARRVRPEGFLWKQPLNVTDFNPTFSMRLDRWLAAQVIEHWVAEAPQTHRLAGSLAVRVNFPEGDRLMLCADPEFAGQVERPLLALGLQRLNGRPWSTRVDHSADDAPVCEALREFKFEPGRTLRWMKLAVR
jgi:ribosomal protein S18 acetylase RimI-like enzyme